MAPRTPLLRPISYFAERGTDATRTLAVVVLATIASLVGIWLLTEIFAARIDGTVLVDNPEHPGEAFCEGPLGENDSDCDRPVEIERDIDAIVYEARGRLLGSLFLAVPVGWLFVGLLLHAGSWLAGGEGGVGDSFAVAAWGLVPSVVALAAGLAVLWLTFDPVTVTSGTGPRAFLDLVLGQLGALRAAGALLGVAATLWSGYVHVGGLATARGVAPSRAIAIAAVVALLQLIAVLG